jgi:thioredoxin-like negative regulator of GroEL
MTIAAISSASSVPPPVDSFRQTFGQLVNALQSGNLTAAQSAYSSLTQAGGGNSNSPFAAALQQIGDALQSGDLGKAQQALAQLQQQLQSARGAHHHGGHHHRADNDDKSKSTTAPASTTTDPTAPATSTSLVDVTA